MMGVELLLVGIGATLFMDVWAYARKRWLGIASLDYAVVGRWLLGLRSGQWTLPRGTPRRPGEAALGWAAHYAIGIALAALLPWFGGPDWIQHPVPGPALLLGLVSVLAPWLILQPALGLGFAASKAPKPWLARWRSVCTHLVFGAGLYFTAWLLH